ncbi:MAG TPA: HAD-IIB family hydrolase [Candidatus Paceibacterota bacterium]
MLCPEVVLFDLDDTLAESFQPPKADMVERLQRLLEHMPVGILSAAGLPRMEQDFLTKIIESTHIERFYVFPNSASECYRFTEGTWHRIYDFEFTEEERSHIKAALEQCSAEIGYRHPEYEAQLWDRGSQIAYAMINSHAPQDVKKTWDPDLAKRKQLKACLEKTLHDYEILIGGSVTIDITRKDVNKAYGITWLSKELSISPRDMLYIGDALYPGGNDSVVIPTGVQTKQTSGPAETLSIIDEILRSC